MWDTLNEKMAKSPTFPTLYDECMQLSISDLKQLGYLKPNHYCSGSIRWTSNGEPTGSIGLKVNTTSDQPYLELNYTSDEKPICYRVTLVTIPSNLGRGIIWAFICPQTGKRTRKLYLVDGYFLHREAFRGCMYECQTYSKKARAMYRAMDGIFAWDKKPTRYFRPYYKGKPTRTLKRLLRKQKQAEGFSIEQLLRM